jgi:hypothetical protein
LQLPADGIALMTAGQDVLAPRGLHVERDSPVTVIVSSDGTDAHRR